MTRRWSRFDRQVRLLKRAKTLADSISRGAPSVHLVDGVQAVFVDNGQISDDQVRKAKRLAADIAKEVQKL